MTTPTKRRRCLWCKKPVTGRADKQFCCPACRKAAFDREAQTDKLRHETRLKSAAAIKHLSPLDRLGNSEFITWLLQQIARHGSIDCLGANFDINKIWSLYRTRGRMAHLTKTAIDVSHLIPCIAGGSFEPENLTLLPSSVNRSQGSRFLPPPGVGKRFKPPARPERDHNILWNKLLKRHRKQLESFANKHANIKGSHRFEAIESILETPGADFVYRSTLQQLDEQRFKDLCNSLNISYTTRLKKGSDSEDKDDGDWTVTSICKWHLYNIRNQLPDSLHKDCVRILRLLTLANIDFEPCDLKDAYTYNFSHVAKRFTNRVLATTSLTPEALEMHLQSVNLDDLFITSDADGSNQHIAVIGDETDADADVIPHEMQIALNKAEAECHKTALNNCKLARLKAKAKGCSPQDIINSIEWPNPYRKERALRYLNQGIDLECM